MRRILALLLVVGLLLAGLVVISSQQARAQTTRMGSWLDSQIWFHQGDPSAALLQMDNNQSQMWMFYLRTVAQTQAAQADPNIGLISTAGSFDDLFVNPVAVDQTKAPGLFNPFQQREAREALNYLVDRNYVVQQVFGGAAAPMTAVWTAQSPEFGRDPVFLSQVVQKYSYNPDLARSMIVHALSSVSGVTFTNGEWLFNGQRIVIQVVERVEDQRLQIGGYVASQLRTLGFLVNENKLTGGAAFAIVYNGPPDTGAWQIYTEGFGATALSAWSDSDPDYFYCGGSAETIWTTGGGPFAPDPNLADACHKLLFGLYGNLTQREALTEKAVALGIQQGVRNWIVAGAIFPYAKNQVTGVTYDLAGGPWSLWTTRTAQLLTPGGLPATGGQLKVGNRLQFVSPWNPWKGFSFLYDVMLYYTFTDVGVWYDPHTGEGIPLRGTFSVTTAGPTGNMSMPATAYTFNTPSNTWTQVGAGKTAISKTTFTYTFGKWHDGSTMAMDDVLYAISLAFRRNNAGADVNLADVDAAGPATKLFVGSFKGLTVDSANQITIYSDYWHIDPSFIALTEDFYPQLPWTASELAVATTLHGNTRISPGTASIAGVTAVDLSKGETLGFMDKEMTTGNRTSSWIPPGFDSASPFAISAAEATARWTALGTPTTGFRGTYGHYFVSNGPFYLSLVDTVNQQVTVTRDPNYPYPADQFAKLIVPKIPSVALSNPAQIVRGSSATVNVTTSVAGQPYDNVSITYLVTDPNTGNVLLQGSPTHVSAGQWQIALTGAQTATLTPGGYTLETVSVGAEAAVPVITQKSVVVIPAPFDFNGAIAIAIGLVNNNISGLRTGLASANAQLASAQSTINGLTTLLYASLGIAVVAVIVAVLSIIVLVRRMPKPGGKGGSMDSGSPKGPEEL